MTASIAGMRWVVRGGIYFGTGADHVYRISKVFFGTGNTNFTWRAEYRTTDGQWKPLKEYCDRLKDAKQWCWYHNQGGLR